ncbi:hypothetical protein BDW72DRAFT_182994 [Aspergillus terricola var. indicus]
MIRGMTLHLHRFLDLIVYGGKLASFNVYSFSFIFIFFHFCFSASLRCISIYSMEVECRVLSIF